MCAGCVISSFATSVPYLYLSYGVITGTLLTLYRMNTLSDSPAYRLVFSFDLDDSILISRYLSKFTEEQYLDQSFRIKTIHSKSKLKVTGVVKQIKYYAYNFLKADSGQKKNNFLIVSSFDLTHL